MSVVIPTIGTRPKSLIEAVQSVARQRTNATVEIVVVVDGDRSIPLDDVVGAAGLFSCRIVESPERRESARQVGSELAGGEFIAYLDDDDVWKPEKLDRQLAEAGRLRAEGRIPIVSSRVAHVNARTGERVQPIPSVIKSEDAPVADYLFRARRPSVGRASIYTSTLLADRRALQRVGWKRIPRHQDWDWLVRVDSSPGVVIAQVDDVLVDIAVGSAGSISASADWFSSLAWARDVLRDAVETATYVDFLSAQPLRYALTARSYDGVRAVSKEIASARRLPSIGPIVIGLAGIVPRAGIERLMTSTGTGRRAVGEPA